VKKLEARVLDRLTVADFVPYVSQTFPLHCECAVLDFVLIDANSQVKGALANAAREPFSLVFRGPVTPVLPQKIYRLEHPTRGSLDIFIVPVGRDRDGVHYEAIFN
jgi:hypothetical protein